MLPLVLECTSAVGALIDLGRERRNNSLNTLMMDNKPFWLRNDLPLGQLRMKCDNCAHISEESVQCLDCKGDIALSVVQNKLSWTTTGFFGQQNEYSKIQLIPKLFCRSCTRHIYWLSCKNCGQQVQHDLALLIDMDGNVGTTDQLVCRHKGASAKASQADKGLFG